MDSAGMQLTDELHRSYGQCYLPLDLQTGGSMVHSYVSLISALLCKSEPGLLGSYFNQLYKLRLELSRNLHLKINQKFLSYSISHSGLDKNIKLLQSRHYVCMTDFGDYSNKESPLLSLLAFNILACQDFVCLLREPAPAVRSLRFSLHVSGYQIWQHVRNADFKSTTADPE